ncbi:hypothetical protein [Lentisalinibacter sediminis]|uniref:hypothetical protein n=1 Tax=Lentisalinibacter sediminis TaxID=2992237 RepID=UPI00386382CF
MLLETIVIAGGIWLVIVLVFRGHTQLFQWLNFGLFAGGFFLAVSSPNEPEQVRFYFSIALIGLFGAIIGWKRVPSGEKNAEGEIASQGNGSGAESVEEDAEDEGSTTTTEKPAQPPEEQSTSDNQVRFQNGWVRFVDPGAEIFQDAWRTRVVQPNGNTVSVTREFALEAENDSGNRLFVMVDFYRLPAALTVFWQQTGAEGEHGLNLESPLPVEEFGPLLGRFKQLLKSEIPNQDWIDFDTLDEEIRRVVDAVPPMVPTKTMIGIQKDLEFTHGTSGERKQIRAGVYETKVRGWRQNGEVTSVDLERLSEGGQDVKDAMDQTNWNELVRDGTLIVYPD